MIGLIKTHMDHHHALEKKLLASLFMLSVLTSFVGQPAQSKRTDPLPGETVIPRGAISTGSNPATPPTTPGSNGPQLPNLGNPPTFWQEYQRAFCKMYLWC